MTTVAELSKLVGEEAGGDSARGIVRVAGFDDAAADAVVFATDDATLKLALATEAGMILAPLASLGQDPRILRVRDPKYAFAVCGKALALQAAHSSRKVPRDEWGTQVYAGSSVHRGAMVDASAKIGAGSTIGAGTVIEAEVVVGSACSIGSNVTLCRGVILGDRVVVQPGAVLGATGFGYVRNRETDEYLLFPQQGGLVIEDDVEIGANTTIDRGALAETRIGRGTKIDNQVHIGHNCTVGKNVVIAAQVGVSGSCVIEDGAVLAGQVGLGDHVTIGKGVILGGASGVFPHKRVDGPGQMFMGVPAEPLKDYLKTLAKVRRLKSRE